MSRPARALVVNAAVAGVAIVTLVPLLWMVSASFMPPGAANTMPPPLVPRTPTLEHYVALFTRLNLLRNFLNSLLISGVTRDPDGGAEDLPLGLTVDLRG